MQTMTEGRDGISLAQGVTAKFMRVAPRLPLVAAMLLFTALVAGTSGTSYAHKPPKRPLLDTVVVSNYGSAFAGSVETFVAGSTLNTKPFKWLKGPNTLLGEGTGAGGDAQSSLTGEIAVTIPVVLLPLPAPNGFVMLFSAGATGNSQPDYLIGSPTAFGAPDFTGLDVPTGVAYANPFYFVDGGVKAANQSSKSSGVLVDEDVIAVTNFAVTVIGPGDYNPIDDIYIGYCAPLTAVPGFSLGTVNYYDTFGLIPFSPPFNGVNDIDPLDNSPVTTPTGSKNASLGGCATFLFGPVGIAFDQENDVYVVNEAGTGTALGAYVTVYADDGYPYGISGNAVPIAIVGLTGPTAGDLINPMFVTVDDDYDMWVTDAGDNSIKVFYAFTNGTSPFLYYQGEEEGVIQGGATKLKRPEGITIADDFNLYVVNNSGNSLNEYADVLDTCCGNVPPTLILSGVIGRQGPGLNLPVGVAEPQFTPTEIYGAADKPD
jgi:hypothetical protein